VLNTRTSTYQNPINFFVKPLQKQKRLSKKLPKDYRFGFNGQEKDNEVSGDGNSYTAEFWQYDPRLGRRFNIDPLFSVKPWMSPYHAFSNKPIINIDPNGANDGWYEGEEGLVFDENVHSQQDLKDRGISGTFKGETVSGHVKGGAGFYGDEKGNLSVSLPSAVVTAPAPASTGPEWAKQAIQGYQSGIFTVGDGSVDYGPTQMPDAVGISVSGTAIPGAGVSTTYSLGYMRGNGFFVTNTTGVGGGWDASGSVSVFAAWYTGNKSTPDFGSYLGLSNANSVGASIFSVGQSADVYTTQEGNLRCGENWNAVSIGISLGLDDLSTVFSGSSQAQYTVPLVSPK
jgi:RHS repeat-associated protein